MRLDQRTILITGGSNGIGLELAKHLLGRHNTVIVTGAGFSRISGSSFRNVEALRRA